MDILKKTIKVFFKVTHTLPVLDKINYVTALVLNYCSNKKFQRENPDFPIPPAYFLYETYKLNYGKYRLSGEEAAKEIMEWVRKYLPQRFNLLEWGCGAGRIIRHIPDIYNSTGTVFGCDISSK